MVQKSWFIKVSRIESWCIWLGRFDYWISGGRLGKCMISVNMRVFGGLLVRIKVCSWVLAKLMVLCKDLGANILTGRPIPGFRPLIKQLTT